MPTIRNVARATKGLGPEIPHLAKGEVLDLRRDMYEAFEKSEGEADSVLLRAIASLQEEIGAVEQSFGAAVVGDAELSTFLSAPAEDISIAGDGLNTAAPFSLFKILMVRLTTAGGLLHGWANFEPVITPAVVAADGDIGAPIVAGGTGGGDPAFSSGQISMTVIFDTDAGATKTYQVGDTITVTIDVSAIGLLSGVASLVKTYNVVA